MEDTTLKQPTMVSRLPKFGSRATPAAGPLTNGSTHNVSFGWAKGVPVGKQNGMISVSAPFPLKGRKGREECGEKVSDSREEARVVRSQQQPRSAVRQIRKPSAAPVVKTQRSIPPVPSTNHRTITQPIKTNPRNTVPKQPSPIQPLCNKIGPAIVAASQGSSSSPQGSLQSSLSHSSDSLKSLSVENVVRSQSFSYSKTPEATTNPPLTRSISFNRATELAKELPRPLAQSPVARSPVTQASMVLGHVSKPATSTCTISSIPPSMLKKSLLPNCTDGKPSLLSYKLTRSSLIKQPRTVTPVKVQGKMQFTERDREKSTPISEPSSNTHSAGTSPEEPFSTKEASDSQGQSLEILEDMSLSSTSSLERNDVSEEYMDDFDDLGHGAGILLMPVNEGKNDRFGLFKESNTLALHCEEGSSAASLHSFVSETVDWADIGFEGNREVDDASHRLGARALSADRDLLHGSSLELSPSDSSGGTYMWDEEVLEPIGRTTQLCRSYESNLNSMDILNKLDNLDSCDLEEDDLMLDVDLPEDVSLHSDVEVASHYDHSESDYWPWRKRQQCRTEQLHYEGRDGVLEAFDNGHTLDLSRRGSGDSSLDELMLEHMAQDCLSVKEQLFHLRTLLQFEEDGSVGEAEHLVSSPSSEEPSYQVDDLLKEVQKLREELRGKDALISKLTQQLSAPVDVTQCVCQQGELQTPERQDKSTQTPWRAQTPQILQPSHPSASEHKKLERATRPSRSEVRSDHVDAQPGNGPLKPQACTVVFPVSATSNATLPSSVPTTAPAVSAAAASLSSSTLNSDNLILLLNTHLRIDESRSPRAHVGNYTQLSRTNQQPSDHHSFSRDRKAPVLMKSRGSEQVGFRRGARGAFGAHLGFSGPSRTRHLPPPSRGLPCISSASQSSLIPSTLNSGIRMISAPRDEEIRAQDLSNACNSRLPKPKSH
ncbi:serine-rich coiled-coil domain-containing protein 2 isoform X2 [Tachysurus vachellii]|uniref:serine-rich coiled-coil domain-containing protein 2 isoform X2 n=1 Tax=Tachysurus vachellii TaxID=175792 RepID=UPI00296AD213|nr:serine-rich coiled-coil domain-containing protein 2 isoform X2 [Tachysurus vachellii]